MNILSENYHDVSPSKRFAVISSQVENLEDIVYVNNFDMYVFQVKWIKDNVRYEVAIDYSTAQEISSDHVTKWQWDYLLGIEFNAAIKYNEELKAVVPDEVSVELDRFLRAYEMGLL